jgi:hypothetical protein
LRANISSFRAHLVMQPPRVSQVVDLVRGACHAPRRLVAMASCPEWHLLRGSGLPVFRIALEKWSRRYRTLRAPTRPIVHPRRRRDGRAAIIVRPVDPTRSVHKTMGDDISAP